MIPFEFDFLRAETPEEAVTAWRAAANDKQTPVYFGGGTELITLARDGRQRFDLAIDYKAIPQALVAGRSGDDYRFGSAVRLTELSDRHTFGLLGACSVGVADRTTRNSITLGGNICGMLPYREAVLPFLLLDARVQVASTDGVRWVELADVFDMRLRLEPGELAVAWSVAGALVQALGPVADAIVDTSSYGAVTAAGAGDGGRWFYYRRTADARVDYPLATVVVAKIDGRVRLALSGVWGYAARARRAETILNQNDALAAALQSGQLGAIDEPQLRQLAANALDAEGRSWRSDQRGAGDYRRELAIQAICAGLRSLAGERE